MCSRYEKEWGTEYHKPGFGTGILTFLFRIIPTSGPFKALKIRTPTSKVEKLFMASFNATVDWYRAQLVQVDTGHPKLTNENFDSGEPIQAGKYAGGDQAYANLVGKLAQKQFAGIGPALRQNILSFYDSVNPSNSGKQTAKEKEEFAKLHEQLDQLKRFQRLSPRRQFHKSEDFDARTARDPDHIRSSGRAWSWPASLSDWSLITEQVSHL
jgi:hypothetical protein